MADELKIGGLAGAGDYHSAMLQNLGTKLDHLKPLRGGPAPEGTAAKAQEIQREGKAAAEFEALLVGELLKSMWRTVPEGGLLSGSREEEYYRDMLNEALAGNISEHASIGVKDMVLKEFKARK